MLQVWLDVVERATKFLHQVVTAAPGPARAPQQDRHLALALLCELAVQGAALSCVLGRVLLLLRLWADTGSQGDNRLSLEGSAAPLVPLIRRLELIPSSGGSEDSGQPEEDSATIHPNQCFLQYVEYPEDEGCCIDLQQAAVVVMAHLDRLARPLCRSSEQPPAGQRCGWWGAGRGLASLDTVVSAAWAGPSLVWVTAAGAVHWLAGDQRATLGTRPLADRDSAPAEVAATSQHAALLSSSGELWWAQLEHAAEVQLVTQLVGRRVVQVCAGQHHVAAVTSQGHVYTWTEDCHTVSPAQVAALVGHTVVQVACGCGPDTLTIALTDAGHVYTWTGAGQTGHLPSLVDTLSGLDTCQLAAGASFFAALTRAGDVYVWGQMCPGAEHLVWPRHCAGVAGARLSAGPGHLAVLDTAGRVWGWGDNSAGQLGPALPALVPSPALLPDQEPGFTGLSCGPGQVLAWTQHTVWTLPSRAPFVIDICEQTFR